MKKYFLMATICFASGLSFVSAQDVKGARTASDIALKKAINSSDRIKYENPAANTSNEYIITGMGGSSFSVSNISDGSLVSFVHSQHITLNLLTANKKDLIELVFYAPDEKIPVAVNQVTDKINIYYPLSMYESIRQKLEQNLSARKRVMLKVSIQTNGFREGELIF